jgi:hypothetical protein
MFCLKINDKEVCKIFAVIVLAASITSCNKPQERSSFFSVDSLVSEQVKRLTKANAKLYKEAALDGKIDTATYLPADTLEWNNELDIFRQLEVINKPVNRQRYQINDGLTDPSSNLTVKEIYTTENLPVAYMRIFYQESIHKPRKIEALFNGDENMLYTSSRLISLHFRQVNNETLLTSYSIQGGQKMMMDDTVTFSIKGRIIVDNNYGKAK